MAFSSYKSTRSIASSGSSAVTTPVFSCGHRPRRRRRPRRSQPLARRGVPRGPRTPPSQQPPQRADDSRHGDPIGSEIRKASDLHSDYTPRFRHAQRDALRLSQSSELRKPDLVRLPQTKRPCIACRRPGVRRLPTRAENRMGTHVSCTRDPVPSPPIPLDPG